MVDPQAIRKLVNGHFEWLLVRDAGRSFPLNSSEIEIETKGSKVLIGMPDDQGFRSWRVRAFSANESDIELELSGVFGKRNEKIRLVPRTSARALALEIEAARLKRTNEIAEAVSKSDEAIKLVRVAIAGDNGRMAQIFFKDAEGVLNALMTDVTTSATYESLLAQALLWQMKLDERKKERIDRVWIAAPTRSARNLQKLLALLKSSAKEKIAIGELSEKTGETVFRPLSTRIMSSLWRERAKKLAIPQNPRPADITRRVADLAPDDADIIFSKQGETVRFAGLPFARIRSMMGQERAWLGINKDKRPLTPENWGTLVELIGDLKNYRQADAPNKHHAFYRMAPEAWLESILLRNINLLDANLILSPIYNQFRASNDKIDLLALRRDGRLVIIELKTSPDREAVFQAAEYWRKIELQRRRGLLADADLFEGREIADKPTLIYIAAPAWSFHRDVEFFARMLAKDIELWRFELHEDWRREVKVIGRVSY